VAVVGAETLSQQAPKEASDGIGRQELQLRPVYQDQYCSVAGNEQIAALRAHQQA